MKRHFPILCLAMIAFLASLGTACDRVSHIVSRSTVTPTLTVTPSPSPTPELVLPPGTEVFREAYSDLDGDGEDERIVAFAPPQDNPDQDEIAESGLAIDGWKTTFARELQIEEMEVRRLNVGENPKVLLFLAERGGILHFLYIYAVEAGAVVVQGPHEGPLDGQEGFRSAHYQPVVEDIDFNGTEEIVVFQEASNPNYLDVIFYEWLQGAYHHSHLFMAIPRRVPTAYVIPSEGG